MQNDNVSLVRVFFRNKWVIAFLALDVIAILAVIAIFAHQATKVSTISFNVAPIGATISMNGDASYKNGRYSVTPGTYEIKISHEDMETKTMTVNIEPRNYTSVITFLSGANNNFDFYKQNKHSSSYQKLKEIASANNNKTTDNDTSAQDFIVDFEHVLSIKEKFPIKGYVYGVPNAGAPSAGFAIRSGQGKRECELASCLLVNYFGKDYKDEVMNKIREAGYNPDDYQFIYERYT